MVTRLSFRNQQRGRQTPFWWLHGYCLPFNQVLQSRESPTSTLLCFTHVPSVSSRFGFEVFRRAITFFYVRFVSSVVSGHARPLILSCASAASKLIRKPQARYQRRPERILSKYSETLRPEVRPNLDCCMKHALCSFSA